MILDDVEGLETRTELADVLVKVFDRVSPRESAVARADAAADGRIDDALWDKLNGEVGVLGLTVPEELGGGGVSLAETAVLIELIGRRVAAIPFLGSFLATEALVRSSSLTAIDRWLEALLGGTAAGAVSWSSGLVAEEDDGGWAIRGRLDCVVDGASANVLICPGTTGTSERWFAVDLTGATRRRLETLDLMREVAEITLEGASAIPLSGGEADLGQQLLDIATLALAVEQLGVAEQAVADAVEYAKVREQFGRAIGSFQALKHLLADMATETDLARSLVEHALWVAVRQPDRLREAAAMAMLAASGAAVFTSGENVQVHGGIGFSWEHPAHLYFRKARSNEVLLASRTEYADRILQAIGAS